MAPVGPHRHGLAYLADAGWRSLFSQAEDACLQQLLTYWKASDLPLVVTRQRCTAGDGVVSLGLPAPIRYGRRRIALSARSSEIARLAPPPTLEHVLSRVGENRLQAASGLVEEFDRMGAPVHVFGSYAWQGLTGLSYLHPHSDLDLLVMCADAATADRAAALMHRSFENRPRIDGELCFAGGKAVAWREWASWRAGSVRSILLKTLRGVSLAERIDEIVDAVDDNGNGGRAA